MRQAILPALIALGLAAQAQAGEPLLPRVRVPGESKVRDKLAISESFLTGLQMTPDDLASVKDMVKRLNEKRVTLIDELKEAKLNLQAAQKAVNEKIAELDQQETTLQDYIKERVGTNFRAEYAVRAQLQPVVAWLKLSNDQVNDLLEKQRELLASDPRPRLLEAARTVGARAAGQPMTSDERKQHIDLLKSAADFNQKWLANIESVLNDEQKKLWRIKYRRTLRPVGGAGL